MATSDSFSFARTSLMYDAGVGVKNGVNFLGGKNALGTFAPPFAVLNDFEFLRTLPQRDWLCGVAEAWKVSTPPRLMP